MRRFFTTRLSGKAFHHNDNDDDDEEEYLNIAIYRRWCWRLSVCKNNNNAPLLYIDRDNEWSINHEHASTEVKEEEE